MKRFRMNLSVLALCMGIAIQTPLMAQKKPVPKAETKITDSKLSTTKYAVETVEYWVKKLQPENKGKAQSLLRDLDRATRQLDRVKDADAKQVEALRSRIADLGKTLTAITEGKSKLTTAATGKKPVANTEMPKQQLQTKSTGTSATKTSNSGLTENDVRQMHQKYHQMLPSIDVPHKGPLTAKSVDDFVAALKSFGEQADRDLPLLKQFAAQNRSVTANSLITFLEEGSAEKLRQNMKRFQALIDSKVQYTGGSLKKLASLDPKKNAYAFTNPDRNKQRDVEFTELSQTLEQAARLQKLLGVPETYAKVKSEHDANLKQWRGHFGDAMKARTLPKDIGDKTLRRIAETVLKNKKYGLGQVERLIVNAKKRSGERIEHKPINGGIETIIRVWEEFQVATVEKEDGKYFLYFNTLRNFSRAPRTTLTNEWILSKRIKSGEISVEKLQ